MMARLSLREHERRELSGDVGTQVVDGIQSLAPTLRPRRSQVVRLDKTVEVRNFIGSVRLADGRVLEVEPKVDASANWTEAVVQLLTEDTRIAVTGSQRSRQGKKRPDLTAVIALEYVRRLEHALRKEGPIQVFERHQYRSRRLNGQLDVGGYARTAWRDPVLFPFQREDLTVANDFARGLSLVSRFFSRSVEDPDLSSRLRCLEADLLPGHPLPGYINPAVGTRPLPGQWSSYRASWDIASAVLRNKSVINDPGHSVGLEVAIEPWPLLETLLERTLNAMDRQSAALVFRDKRRYPLLYMEGKSVGEVEPDGVLVDGAGQAVATFEAKYTSPGAYPSEAHRYQALTAAAVLKAPLAVIVYPTAEKPKVYDVSGFDGHPARLATIGLDMFNYRRASGDDERASTILSLISMQSTT